MFSNYLKNHDGSSLNNQSTQSSCTETKESKQDEILRKKLERKDKIRRYLEKKKNRKYNVLRYEVRKKIAKTRQRVKGRFVKEEI